MGCAPPMVPTAGKEVRLSWSPKEKQAVRASTPVALRTCSQLHVQVREQRWLTMEKAMPQGVEKTFPSCPILWQFCTGLPDTVNVKRRG